MFTRSEYNSNLSPVIYAAVIGVAAALLIALVIIFITSRLLKPLGYLTSYMEKAGTTGCLILEAEDQSLIHRLLGVKDAFGQCISARVSFVDRVTDVSKRLETVASGDLTAVLSPLSEKDTLAISLNRMNEKLNMMFGDIKTATQQVSSGAGMIADGAQALAQGSTEQASTVMQLSSSISDIAFKTKANAEMAERASGLARTIMENAEKGSRQMDEMTLAVKDINQASNSISKVIKVIDDIAFQTNILALNAAVEAARAGQHGKGFAVVAEEVRNLAAKSAEAAKDTGGLIANSMEKAELGARIAGETAASLADIVSGISESSQLVNEIAVSSEEQNIGIAQINHGIEQVTQVVQQNSATAQESAAASSEMSDQSDSLQQLISQFKLNEGGAKVRSLPPRY